MKKFDSQLTIRNARLADVAAITEIYNEAILTTTATFDTTPKSVSDRLEDVHRFKLLAGSALATTR